MLAQNVGSNFSVKYGMIQTYTAGAHIYRGALIAVRLTNGKAYPAEEDITDVLKQFVVGFAMEEAQADATVRVRQDGKLLCASAGTFVAGCLALVKDDEAVQPYTLNTGKVVVGRVTEVFADKVYVDLQSKPSRLASSLYD